MAMDKSHASLIKRCDGCPFRLLDLVESIVIARGEGGHEQRLLLDLVDELRVTIPFPTPKKRSRHA